MALRCRDFDVKNGVVSVRHTLTRSGGKVVFGGPRIVKKVGLVPGPFLIHTVSTCKTGRSQMWACLDSNQGPLPYQRNRPMSALYRFVRDTGLYKAFLAFCRRTLVRWIPSSIARVGVSVGVKPDWHWRLLLLCWIGSRLEFCPATDSSRPSTQRETRPS